MRWGGLDLNQRPMDYEIAQAQLSDQAECGRQSVRVLVRCLTDTHRSPVALSVLRPECGLTAR
jgi:hypothetical protein